MRKHLTKSETKDYLNSMVNPVTKRSHVSINSLLLFLTVLFVACNTDTTPDAEHLGLSLKPIVLDMEDTKTRTVFNVEMVYPEHWTYQMINPHVFQTSEDPKRVNDGYVNHFHAVVFHDSLNYELKRYSNNFLIQEQNKFPNTHFEVLHSGVHRANRRMEYQIEHIKIWGGTDDPLFQISALAKANKRIVHLNFYGIYEEKEALENLAKSVLASVRVKG